MEKLLNVKAALERRGFKVLLAEDGKSAAQQAAKVIGNASTGFGGSLTVERLGLYERLKQSGNRVFWHWKDGGAAKADAACADFYVCSANAITEDGLLVITDGSGNRVAGLSFGPKNALVIAGKNKIVGNLAGAFARIKSGQCAGKNAARLGLDTPCATTGVCADCNGAQKICSVTAVFEQPSKGLQATYVILVNEELGL